MFGHISVQFWCGVVLCGYYFGIVLGLHWYRIGVVVILYSYYDSIGFGECW